MAFARASATRQGYRLGFSYNAIYLRAEGTKSRLAILQYETPIDICAVKDQLLSVRTGKI